MTATTQRSPFIVSGWYDSIFFLATPSLALVLGALISGTDFADVEFTLLGEDMTGAGLCIGTLIHAHLVAVFLRSHANPQIRPLHRLRFFVVPVVVCIVVMLSAWVGVIALVLVVFWDVWHSSLQTFGFARIYARNAGSPPELGRRADYWLSHLLYIGPLVSGATAVYHFDSFRSFEDVGTTFFSRVPVFVGDYRGYAAWAFVAVGTLYLACYVGYQVVLTRRGYRPSFQKVFLLVSTAACSIYAWGFNSFGEAFFIMNFFHAVQYLALVWASEHRHLVIGLRLANHPRGKALTLAVVLATVFAYGFGVQIISSDSALWAVTITVSLMHFWYDGFIWSVAKRQV